MADYKLIGKDYQTPDIEAKVQGKAKYAEDYRADGMLFCKLLLSPRPHARVRSVDTSEALAIPGVHAVLRASELPPPPPPAAGRGGAAAAPGRGRGDAGAEGRGGRGAPGTAPDGRGAAPDGRGGRGAAPGGATSGAPAEGGPAPQAGARGGAQAPTTPAQPQATPAGQAQAAGQPAARGGPAATAPAAPPAAPLAAEVALTDEPMYEGEPILAVAADSEELAALAIEKIVIDFEPLPFVVDPLDSLRPGGANARSEGNVFVQNQLKTIKWTAADFDLIAQGKFPMSAEAGVTQEMGDVEAALKGSDLVLEEYSFQQSTSHQPLESRSAMAYWRNDKLFLHGSTQSVAQTVANVARWTGIPPAEANSRVVVISEYTGGGFGSKIPGAQTMAIPAMLSKKLNGRPVMMRISREEETYIGRTRPGFQAGVRMGFMKDGRVTAIDAFIIEDSGPYRGQGDNSTAMNCATILYQPTAARFRGLSVATNTPPRVSQRAPGGLQASVMFEPIISKAARKLGIDEIEMRKLNAPATGSQFGINANPASRARLTSAFLKETLDKGRQLFNWDERVKHNGQRRGTKVRGVAVGTGTYVAGSIGFDGLFVIKPDGKVYINQGVGNLGTHSVFDTARVIAEVLDCPWESCVVSWGDTSKGLAWSSSQAGSQTAHAHSRANHAAAMDGKLKLQELAALELGGRAEDYQVSGGRVSRGGRGLTFAEAAERAIKRGGKFDGHEVPADINAMTKHSASTMVGQGLMGVARDNYGRQGSTYSFVAGFAEIEVDVETGQYTMLDYLAVADVGTVLHPRALGAQLHGGAVQGFSHVRCQKLVYDTHYGNALATRMHYNKPPTILDNPLAMTFATVDLPDPQTPVGAKGIGEAAICAGGAALMCALAAAVGDDIIRRTPVQPEMIVTGLEAKRVAHDPFKAYI